MGMIEYRMMTEDCVLCICVHGGPLPLSKTCAAETRSTWKERELGLPDGTVARFLQAMCRTYGSCGILAIDGDAVVGHLRFYPAGLDDVAAGGFPCVQMDEIRALRDFDAGTLPPKNALAPAALRIHCFHVAGIDGASYRRRGIGTTMLETMIDWARAAGWEELRAGASEHIPPIYEWSGQMSVERYSRLGFRATATPGESPWLQAVRNMRAGHHGERVKTQWEAFAHLSDEEAAQHHDVVLDLSQRD